MKEELLTLADRSEYYKNGTKPWPDEWQKPHPKGENAAHDRIKLLLGENDKLIANQLALRESLKDLERAKKRERGIAISVILAAWSPLWLPLAMKWVGLK